MGFAFHMLWPRCGELPYNPELLIRGSTEDNSKLIFLISQWKHMLWPLIKTVSMRRFWWWVTTLCFKGVIWKIIPKLSLLPNLIWSTANLLQTRWFSSNMAAPLDIWKPAQHLLFYLSVFTFHYMQCQKIWTFLPKRSNITCRFFNVNNNQFFQVRSANL